MKYRLPKMIRTGIQILTCMILFMFLAFTGTNTQAQTVVPGNPDCCTINTIPGLHDNSPGNNLGIKIEGFGTGGFNLTLPLVPGPYITLTCNSGAWSGDPNNSITITSAGGVYFDWSCTLAIDAVIVKGGPDANVYYYEPESFGGQGLSAPINPNNGMPYGISHIEICFDYEIDIDCPDNVYLQCPPDDWNPATNPVFQYPTIIYPPVYICDNASLSYTDVSDGLTCPETVTRTWTVTDDCGDEATCTQLIIIDDDTPPVLSCPPPLSAVCSINEHPVYGSYAEFISAGGSATDNCEIDEDSFILISETSDGNTCPEVVTRTYQIADLCGNTDQCTQTITIDDETAPEITCPGPLTAVCDLSEQPAYTTYAAFMAAGGSATDNCSIDESSFTLFSEVSDGNTCPEVVTRTYQIEDLCGNIAQCTQTITIDDDTPPSMTCPGPLMADCHLDEQPAYASYAAFVAAGGSASDNCDIDETSFTLVDETSDGNFCPEVVTRTYQVADLCGNTTTCQQTITIDDEVPPVLNCPPALTASCTIDEQPPYTTYSAFVTAGGSATDNCGIDEASFTLINEVSDGNTCPEVVTRTYQVADLCGNTGTCQQIITVDDQTAPELTCPDPLTAVCNISEQPVYTDYAAFVAAGGSASDNCDINESTFTWVDDVSDGNTCPETITRTYQIADLCGNIGQCQQTITIDDEVDPVITCPGPLTAVCDISEQPPYGDVASFIAAGGSVSDNCDIDPASFTWVRDDSDGNSCPEVITRTYQVADLCGNTAECTQTITIDDETDPAITCPGPLTAVCSINEQPAYVDYAAFESAGGSASDNCDIDESSFMLFSETSDGNTCPEVVTRIYQIADLCGNTAQCTQTITIDDDVPPVLNCPPPLTASCSITEQPAYTDYAAFVSAGGSASDNCDIDESSFTLINEVSDGNTCPEIVTRTYQIADLCGNTATCQQTITVDDLTDPVITCPGPLSAVCSISEQPSYTNFAAFVAAGGSASDNCDIVESSFMMISAVSDGNTCPEVITRTYQIADICGNTATCEQTITIDDEVDPVLNCPGPLTAVCDISEQPPYTDYATFVSAGGSASDNCDVDITTFTWVSDVSDNNTCPEVITRTYQIEDLCGNIGQCTQTITINDETDPAITCPGPLTAVCDISEQPSYATFAAFVAAGGSASDNCDIDESSFTLVDETSDGNSCPEVVTRTYQIADLCGNTATCQQTITIDDDVLPVLNCPAPLTATCSITEQPAYTDYAAFVADGGSASDNCDIDETSFTLVSEVSDGNDCPEIVTRTYQIADLCGNTATCQQTITIDDQTDPTLNCPGPLTAVCSIGEVPPYADYAAFVTAGGIAYDNCGVDMDSFTWISDVSDGNSCPETFTRTYQIADLCGNIATCEQIITVDDQIEPVITCPGPLTAVCSINEVTPYADYNAFVAAGGSASDNCDIDQSTFTWVSDVSDNNSCPEVITRTYQIEDLCGNIGQCSQTITIDDEVDPVITCPGPLTAICDIGEQPPYADYNAFVAAGGSASDNCDIDPASFTWAGDISDLNSCPEVITRTYQIADLCGNIATCEQTITIDDEVPPVLNCPPGLTASCSITEQPPYADYDAFDAAGGSATDNCDIDELSFMLINEVSDGNTCPEIVTRTYQIADLCGNTATCQQTITINDVTAPTFICPEPLTAVCSISEQPAYTDYASFIAAGGTAYDECGVVESSFMLVGVVSDGNTCPEVVTRTYQIEDLCGNTSTCQQTITIDDQVDPVLNCPGPLTAVCDASEHPYYADYAAFVAAGGSASDNCDIVVSSFTWAGDVSDGNTCPEVITRTYQIEDLCGNIGQCTQTITVDDDVLPTITCPGPLTAVCDISEQPAYTDYTAFVAAGGSASDNCDIDESSFMLAGEVSDGNTCPEVVTRTYQIADLCGNTATCQQIITIDDDVPPVLIYNGPNYFEGYCGDPVYIEVTATDNCSDPVTINCTRVDPPGEIPRDCDDPEFYSGTTTLTYVAVDDCGNESGSLTITVYITSPVPCEIMLPDQGPFCYMLENTAWAGPNTQAGAVSFHWFFDQQSIDNGWMITDGEYSPYVEYTSGSDTGWLYMSFVDTNGCEGECFVKIGCIPAWEICTMTQGFYGNAGGTFCNGQGTYDLLDSMFVANGGSLMVGEPGASLTVGSLDPAQCVINILPGGGPAKALDKDWTCDNLEPPMIHKKTGKLRNILVAQTLTLNLNMWLTPDLGDMPIVTDVLTIAPTTGCGPYSMGNYSINNFSYYQFPSAVLTELEMDYGDDPMISDLLDYANRGIGGENLNVSLSEIVDAVNLINEAFDECMTGTFDGGYVPMNFNSMIAMDPHEGLYNNPVRKIEMAAYPNPFSANAFIEFTIPETDKVSLRVYTLNGMKVADLFEATAEPDTKYTVEFSMDNVLSQQVFVYVLRTSKEIKHGRIVMIR